MKMLADSNSTKKALLTSPTFAACFTLFSLLCTAFFVLSDRTYPSWPSSFTLLFHNDTLVFTTTSTNVGTGFNGSVLGGKDGLSNKINGTVVNSESSSSLDKKDGYFSVNGDLGTGSNVLGKDDLLNSMNGSGNTESLKVGYAKDRNFSGNGDLGRGSNGSVSSKDRHFSENGDLGRGSNGSVSSGKDSLGGSDRLLDNKDGNFSGNSDLGGSSNGSVLSGNDSLLNTVNETRSRESKKDWEFSENDDVGGSSNGSVSGGKDSLFKPKNRDGNRESTKDGYLGGNGSLLDKKDGHFSGNGDLSRGPNGSVLSGKDSKIRGKDILSNPMNKSVNGELDKKDGQPRENYNNTVMNSGVIVSNSSVPSKIDGHFGGSNSSSDPTNRTVNSESVKAKTENQRKEDWWEKMIGCDFFDGSWMEDNTYPLYKPGSCPHIDEPFDCYRNGRPDNGYEKFRWQPKGCNIPRLNGRDMLEMLRGKRLVYVGDSLNRNMWESMVCALRNSVKDKRRVFEASGKRDFRTEHSYSFIFLDYNCSVEFFRSTFLVREWDMPDTDGVEKETLRLDMVARSFDRFKNADILVFNTGHWWTHEKTALGKGYYQEGSHVYDELNVMEAFRRAMTTWGRWLDENINPKKTLVVFRGYSQSHFSGGQWNSGGQCDSETVPIKNETYLKGYPSKMSTLEKVLSGMRTPVLLLNVSKMTDFRKDAHPSIYRSQHLTEEEKKSPLRFQDCSHWCLPGVPETWNELLYAQIFTKYKQEEKEKQQRSR